MATNDTARAAPAGKSIHIASSEPWVVAWVDAHGERHERSFRRRDDADWHCFRLASQDATEVTMDGLRLW